MFIFPTIHHYPSFESSGPIGAHAIPRILHPSPDQQAAGAGLLAGGVRRGLVPSPVGRVPVHAGRAERAHRGQSAGGDGAPWSEAGPARLRQP